MLTGRSQVSVSWVILEILTSRRRLCRSRDFIHTVLAFAFLALVGYSTALARFLAPAIFGECGEG